MGKLVNKRKLQTTGQTKPLPQTKPSKSGIICNIGWMRLWFYQVGVSMGNNHHLGFFANEMATGVTVVPWGGSSVVFDPGAKSNVEKIPEENGDVVEVDNGKQGDEHVNEAPNNGSENELLSMLNDEGNDGDAVDRSDAGQAAGDKALAMSAVDGAHAARTGGWSFWCRFFSSISLDWFKSAVIQVCCLPQGMRVCSEEALGFNVIFLVLVQSTLECLCFCCIEPSIWAFHTLARSTVQEYGIQVAKWLDTFKKNFPEEVADLGRRSSWCHVHPSSSG